MCEDCNKGTSAMPRDREHHQGMEAVSGGLRGISDDELLNEIFRYHAPDKFAAQKYENIREAARHFAKVLLMNVPPGADRTCALRHVRDAVMTANSGVALNGLSF
jgi:hypothetical protein